VELKVEHGVDRNTDQILATLTAAGIQIEGIKPVSSPDYLGLQAAGGLDFPRLRRAIIAAADGLCPEETALPIRIVRELEVFDLLYWIPCDDSKMATDALERDIRNYTNEDDSFRSWFRGQWMGNREEEALTVEELSSEPLTPERILAFLDPPVFRDWRPIFRYIERHAKCDQLVGAMAKAETPTQRWRLAYAFHRGRRSCKAAVPALITWLSDRDRKVREEAAYSIGSAILAIRHPTVRFRLGREAGAALLDYVVNNPNDNLYFARTSLGATGHEPARPYLEELARSASGNRQESAERGLANLNMAVSSGGLESAGGARHKKKG